MNRRQQAVLFHGNFIQEKEATDNGKRHDVAGSLVAEDNEASQLSMAEEDHACARFIESHQVEGGF